MIYIYRKGTSTNESLQTCLSVAPQKVFSGHPEYEICCQTYNLCRPNHSVKKQKPNKQEKETKPLKELFEKKPGNLFTICWFHLLTQNLKIYVVLSYCIHT